MILLPKVSRQSAQDDGNFSGVAQAKDEDHSRNKLRPWQDGQQHHEAGEEADGRLPVQFDHLTLEGDSSVQRSRREVRRKFFFRASLRVEAAHGCQTTDRLWGCGRAPRIPLEAHAPASGLLQNTGKRTCSPFVFMRNANCARRAACREPIEKNINNGH